MSRSGLDSLRKKIAMDIGLFVQACGSLEVELDDLMCLANDRFGGTEPIVKRYPRQLSEKIAIVPKIAKCADFVLSHELKHGSLDIPLELRQRLVHGRVTDLRATRSSYEFRAAKMEYVGKDGDVQQLLRDHKTYTYPELLDCSRTLSSYRKALEQLRIAVFQSGDGWPDYLVVPEAYPLGLENVHQVIEANK